MPDLEPFVYRFTTNHTTQMSEEIKLKTCFTKRWSTTLCKELTELAGLSTLITSFYLIKSIFSQSSHGFSRNRKETPLVSNTSISIKQALKKDGLDFRPVFGVDHSPQN